MEPTPNNGTTVHTDSVNIEVEIEGPEVGPSEPKLFFDEVNGFTSDGLNNTEKGTEFINLSLQNTTGTYESRIYNATVNTTWDNISWSEILPTDGETVPNGNTVLLFHMNNDSDGENDTFIYDFSLNGNNGTAVGDVPTINGNISGGFEFDGVDDYVDAGSGDSIDDVHTFTWEAWVRPHLDTDGQSHRVIVKGTGGGQKRLYLVHGASGAYLNVVVDYDATDANTVTAVNSVLNNQWYHVAVTFDNSGDKKPHIYINGVWSDSVVTAGAGNIVSDASGKLYFGTDAGFESARMYDGIMDETVIWNKVLTNDEISAHANATYIGGEIKFQTRSCNDANCDTEVFEGPASEADYYTTPQNLNVDSNKFFQYKAFFSTSTAGTSPELYNVTVEGHTVVIPPELNIDSAWVDWNGNNITLDGSGLSWSKTLTSLSEGDYTYRVYAND